jgi:2-keto-4-pentenoate hydratase/2-oxohepta-3-ene-1,7-dioic acid hydratase in catechol pathway
LNTYVNRLKPNGTDFKIPWHAADGATVHEVELGVILNGLKAHEGTWLDRIGAYVLLLDMGDFSMIKSAISNGHSWTISKQ